MWKNYGPMQGTGHYKAYLTRHCRMLALLHSVPCIITRGTSPQPSYLKQYVHPSLLGSQHTESNHIRHIKKENIQFQNMEKVSEPGFNVYVNNVEPVLHTFVKKAEIIRLRFFLKNMQMKKVHHV